MRRRYREILGPGLLGEFTGLRRILGAGAGLGGVSGLMLAVAGDATTWTVPVAMVAGPVLVVLAVVVGVGAITFAVAGDATWIRSPEQLLRRFESRIEAVAQRLERFPPSIATIPAREALVSGIDTGDMREEVLRMAPAGYGASLAALSGRVNRVAEAERERVLRHLESPQALAESGRIVDVPPGPPLIRVFERRGAARAGDVYALALHVLLRHHVLSRAAGGDLLVLVEAPEGFAACLALDGWFPRGEAAGPVDATERETIIALWDEGSSRVYTDAAELLDAARRL